MKFPKIAISLAKYDIDIGFQSIEISKIAAHQAKSSPEDFIVLCINLAQVAYTASLI